MITKTLLSLSVIVMSLNTQSADATSMLQTHIYYEMFPKSATWATLNMVGQAGSMVTAVLSGVMLWSGNSHGIIPYFGEFTVPLWLCNDVICAVASTKRSLNMLGLIGSAASLCISLPVIRRYNGDSMLLTRAGLDSLNICLCAKRLHHFW